MVTAGISDKQFLNNLRQEAAREFQALQQRVVYPKGEKIFVEGSRPSGVFVLSTGGVKLTDSDSNGGVLASRKARRSEVLGLSATVAGKPHQTTAQTTSSSELGFIPREDLLHFLREHSDAAFRVVELLSNHLAEAPVRRRTRGARNRKLSN